MRRRIQPRCCPRGSVIVIALFVMFILSMLGITLLTVSGMESDIAHNALWAEGAFAAAEAGVQTGLSQLGPDVARSTQQIPSVGTSPASIEAGAYRYQYRSGHKADATPQPLVFKGRRNVPGYNLALGTGYNPGGYSFNTYQINATGTGPRSSQREIEVLAQYGPIP